MVTDHSTLEEIYEAYKLELHFLKRDLEFTLQEFEDCHEFLKYSPEQKRDNLIRLHDDIVHLNRSLYATRIRTYLEEAIRMREARVETRESKAIEAYDCTLFIRLSRRLLPRKKKYNKNDKP